MSEIKKDIGRDPDEKLAIKAARERGFTDKDIWSAQTSLEGALGGVLKQSIEDKGYETEEFSKMSGIPTDELRLIYQGFVEPGVMEDRFGAIAEALEMNEERIRRIREIFFKQEL